MDALAADAAVPSSVHPSRSHGIAEGAATTAPTPVVTRTSALRRTFASAPSVGRIPAGSHLSWAVSMHLV